MDDPVVVVPLWSHSIPVATFISQEVCVNIRPARHLHSLTVMNIYFAGPPLSVFR